MKIKVEINGNELTIDDENFAILAEAILKYAKDKRLAPKQPEFSGVKK